VLEQHARIARYHISTSILAKWLISLHNAVGEVLLRITIMFGTETAMEGCPWAYWHAMPLCSRDLAFARRRSIVLDIKSNWPALGTYSGCDLISGQAIPPWNRASVAFDPARPAGHSGGRRSGLAHAPHSHR